MSAAHLMKNNMNVRGLVTSIKKDNSHIVFSVQSVLFF